MTQRSYIIVGGISVVCIGIVVGFFSYAPRTVIVQEKRQEEKIEQGADVEEALIQEQETAQSESTTSTETDSQSSTSNPPSSPQPLSTKTQEKEIVATPAFKDRYLSWGYSTEERKKVDAVIIHSSYNSLGGDPYGVDKILDIYRSYDVSAHYIIDRAGTIYRLVSEKNVSWHAGQSTLPDGRTDVNASSIGIELVNDLHDDCTDAQYAALALLLDDIKSRHAIRYVLGHDDIAPGRKTDPWNFSWKRIGGKEK